jgi:hypothetical protein
MVKISTVFSGLRKCCGRGQVEGRKGKASTALCASAYARMLPPPPSFGGTGRRDESAYARMLRRDESASARMLPPPPSFGATSPPALGCFRLHQVSARQVRLRSEALAGRVRLRSDASARQAGATSRRDKPVFAHGRCRPPFSAARASGLAGSGCVSPPGTRRGGTPLEPAARTAAPRG